MRKINPGAGIFFMLFLMHLTHFLGAQTFRVNYAGAGEGWKLELRTGTGVLFSEVPEKYLENLNNVNIPAGRPGLAAIAALRKMATKHFEVGYQFDYMRIRGYAKPKSTEEMVEEVEVLTQGMGHNFILSYYFREREEEDPMNFFLQHKIGALSLNNKRLGYAGEQAGTDFLGNIAVITAIGAGITYKLNRNVRLTAMAEYNRSADTMQDLYRPYKLFYYSPNTVNNFLFISAGISFRFDFRKKNKKILNSSLPFSKR